MAFAWAWAVRDSPRCTQVGVPDLGLGAEGGCPFALPGIDVPTSPSCALQWGERKQRQTQTMEVLHSFAGCYHLALFTEDLGGGSVTSMEVPHPNLGIAQSPVAPFPSSWGAALQGTAALQAQQVCWAVPVALRAKERVGGAICLLAGMSPGYPKGQVSACQLGGCFQKLLRG